MSLYDATRIRHPKKEPSCRAAVKGVQFGPGRSEGERVVFLVSVDRRVIISNSFEDWLAWDFSFEKLRPGIFHKRNLGRGFFIRGISAQI